MCACFFLVFFLFRDSRISELFSQMGAQLEAAQHLETPKWRMSEKAVAKSTSASNISHAFKRKKKEKKIISAYLTVFIHFYNSDTAFSNIPDCKFLLFLTVTDHLFFYFPCLKCYCLCVGADV